MAIGMISGHDLSKTEAKKFMMQLEQILNCLFDKRRWRGITEIFFSGVGDVISGVCRCSTSGLGQAAIAYFIEEGKSIEWLDIPKDEAKNMVIK